MVTRARALPRRLLRGGAAGDAGTAGGRQIVSNIVVQLLGRLVMIGVSVITVSLTARTLNPTGYGIWNGVSSYVGLFGVFTDLGFTMAAMQKMAAEPEREAEWLGALAGARTALSFVVLVLCAASVPLFLSNAGPSHLVAYITMATITLIGATCLTSVFQTRLRSALVQSLNILQSFIWLAVVLVLWLTKGSVVAFAAADTALLTLMAFIQWHTTRRFAKIAWRKGMRLWRSLLKIAVPLGIANISIAIYWQVDSVLLLQLAGPHASGIYGSAYGFLAPLTFLPAAVMSSVFPVLSAVHGRDPQRTGRLFQISADTMALMALPVLAGTIALSGPIIHLMYGHEFARAAGLLPILMIAFVSICYGALAGYMAPILSLQWRLATYAAIGALSNVVLNLVLIPPYGAYGSAWATVATELVTMIPMLITVLRRMHLRLSPWKILQTAGLATAMTALMVLARPLGLLPAGTIGVVFYAIGVLTLRIVDRDEIRALRPRST